MSSNQPKIDGVFRTRSLGAAASGEKRGVGRKANFEVLEFEVTFEAECNIIPPGNRVT